MTSGSPRQLRRRENLRKLVDANGGQAQVALDIGTPKSHLSAILAGRRGLGDALAQKIERHYEKPEGWMDEQHAATAGVTLVPEVAELATAINQLPKRQRDIVLMSIRNSVDLVQALQDDGVIGQGSAGTPEHTDLPPLRRLAR